jgi:septal ring-binding cell division protein DamX
VCPTRVFTSTLVAWGAQVRGLFRRTIQHLPHNLHVHAPRTSTKPASSATSPFDEVVLGRGMADSQPYCRSWFSTYLCSASRFVSGHLARNAAEGSERSTRTADRAGSERHGQEIVRSAPASTPSPAHEAPRSASTARSAPRSTQAASARPTAASPPTSPGSSRSSLRGTPQERHAAPAYRDTEPGTAG